MAKYKKGTVLVPKPYYKGFERIYIDWVGTKLYHCKILCGTATIPIHIVDENYQILEK